MNETEEYLISGEWDNVVMTLTRIPTIAATGEENPNLPVEGPFPPCSTCKKTRGHPCTTAGGKPTEPHKPRIDMATGYTARTPEVTALRHQLAAAGDADEPSGE